MAAASPLDSSAVGDASVPLDRGTPKNLDIFFSNNRLTSAAANSHRDIERRPSLLIFQIEVSFSFHERARDPGAWLAGRDVQGRLPVDVGSIDINTTPAGEIDRRNLVGVVDRDGTSEVCSSVSCKARRVRSTAMAHTIG